MNTRWSVYALALSQERSSRSLTVLRCKCNPSALETQSKMPDFDLMETIENSVCPSCLVCAQPERS